MAMRYTSIESILEKLAEDPSDDNRINMLANALQKVFYNTDGYVSPVHFGWSTTATAAQNTAAFHEAVANMVEGDTLLVPPGDYAVNNCTFAPNITNAGLVMYGSLIASTTGVCLTIGTEGTFRSRYWGRGLRVDTVPADWTAGRVGIDFINLKQSEFEIDLVRGFEDGVVVRGYGTGCVYNKFHLKALYNSKYNLHLKASDGGWTNHNQFYGGFFVCQNVTGTIPADAVFLVVDHYSTHRISAIEFFHPCFEGADAKAATINGDAICIIDPYVEMTGLGTPIELTSECRYGYFRSMHCLGSGASEHYTDNSDVADQNIIVYPGKIRFPASATCVAGLEFGSTILMGTYSGSPEGALTADIGSLVLDKTNGYPWFKKKTNGGNTGWVPLETMRAHSVYVGDITATKTFNVLSTKASMSQKYRLAAVDIVSAQAVAQSDVDYWSVMVYNYTSSDDMMTTAKTTKTTGGQAMTAHTPWVMTCNTHYIVGASSVVQVQLTRVAGGAGPSDITDALIVLHYRVEGD